MTHEFRHDDHHESCLSLRPIGDDDELFHLGEWRCAVEMLGRANVPTVAFFVLRHLAELVLKRIISEVTGVYAHGHDLDALLETLPEDDPLRVGAAEPERSVRTLVRAVSAVDASGVAARYAFDRSGRPSFDDETCMRPDAMGAYAEMLWDYCLDRAGAWHAPGAIDR